MAWPWKVADYEQVMAWYLDTKHLHTDKVDYSSSSFQGDLIQYAKNFTSGDQVCTGIQLSNMLKHSRKKYTNLKAKLSRSGSEAFDPSKLDRKMLAIWNTYEEILSDKYGGKTVGPVFRSKTVSIPLIPLNITN